MARRDEQAAGQHRAEVPTQEAAEIRIFDDQQRLVSKFSTEGLSLVEVLMLPDGSVAVAGFK